MSFDESSESKLKRDITHQNTTDEVQEGSDEGKCQCCSPLATSRPVDVDCSDATNAPVTAPVVAPIIVIPASRADPRGCSLFMEVISTTSSQEWSIGIGMMGLVVPFQAGRMPPATLSTR